MRIDRTTHRDWTTVQEIHDLLDTSRRSTSARQRWLAQLKLRWRAYAYIRHLDAMVDYLGNWVEHLLDVVEFRASSPTTEASILSDPEHGFLTRILTRLAHDPTTPPDDAELATDLARHISTATSVLTVRPSTTDDTTN